MPPPDWTRRPNAKDDLRDKARQLRELTPREILIAGAVAYWCEGAKSKPHRQLYCVIFMNSDPGLIRLFLRFLDTVGVPRGDLVFTVCIHVSGDVAAAQQFWLEVTQAGSEQFNRPSLKRHNPSTTRKNVGVDYHGCLRIGVHQSSALVRKIEGWAQAIMADPTEDESQVSNRPS